MLDPVANTLDLRQPFTKERAARVRKAIDATGVGLSDVGYFDNLLHHDPAIRKKKHRLHAAHVRRGGGARRRRRVRLRRPQPGTQHGPEPPGLRAALRAAAEGGEGARADVPRRAVPDARLDHRRQLAQQHRLHAGDVDRAAPHRREARRRRSVPHPLRPVARHPDGAGHALDLPVPEGRGLQLPHRRLPREGPGRRRQGLVGVGQRRPDRRARRLEGRQAVAEPGRSGQRLEEAGRPRRARAARHGAPRSAGLSPEPQRRLARSPAGGARAARARRGQHAPRRRARVPEGAHPGQGAARRRSCRGRSPSSATSTKRPARMFALQHDVLAAQGIPVQGVGRQAFARSAVVGGGPPHGPPRTAISDTHVTHRTRRQDGRRHRRNLRHRPDHGDRPRRRRRQRRRHRPPRRADRLGRARRSRRRASRRCASRPTSRTARRCRRCTTPSPPASGRSTS